MNDSSSVMSEDDQGIEKLECRRCNNEHVDRRNVGQVVVQKATPGRGWDFGPPRQVSPDRGLADLDAEPEDFGGGGVGARRGSSPPAVVGLPSVPSLGSRRWRGSPPRGGLAGLPRGTS